MEQKMARFPALPQLAKIAALLLLFLLVPFVPPSLRAPYLYLLFNALVLALGVQAGFLSVSAGKSSSSSMPGTSSLNLHTKLNAEAAAAVLTTNAADHHLLSGGSTLASPMTTKLQAPLIQLRDVKLLADRAAIKEVVGVARKLKETIKKCPSRASIFFIGSVDPNDDGEVVDATVQEDRQAEEGQKKWKVDNASSGDLMSKQELYTKAEAFIGNFYKQLKMQREDSWNKLQDLYSYHHHYMAKAF